MKDKFNSGIYCIVNTIDNKRYIGQAVDLTKREMEHFCNKKSNVKLSRAMNKYGKQNFEFIVLEYVPASKNLLDAAEQKWFDYFKDNHKEDRLYNLCLTASTVLGLKRTKREGQLTRERCSKKVYQFTLEGKFVKEYSSAIEAGKETSISSDKISCCRRKKRINAGGFIWLGALNYDEVEILVAYNKSKRDAKKSPVELLKEDVSLVFSSLLDASLYLNGTFGNVSKAIRTNKPYKNYICKHA